MSAVVVDLPLVPVMATLNEYVAPLDGQRGLTKRVEPRARRCRAWRIACAAA